VPLVAAFTLAAAAASRAGRAGAGVVEWERLAVGTLTALAILGGLRVLDEHKDAAADRLGRPALPVPRGLVTLGELRAVAGVALGVALAANLLVAPRLLWPCLAIAAWTALTSVEFGAPGWLRAHPGAYLVSHGLVVPMIGAYATGLDWLAAGVAPPPGLWLFLAVALLDGLLLEVGRKILDTYARAWGARRATAVWLVLLAGTAVAAGQAARLAGAGSGTALAFGGSALAAAVPAAGFLRHPDPVRAGRIDAASRIWTLGLYLALAAMPVVAGGG
jgi:4-hydroxybenzoate polyprenyltransferase